MRLSPESAGSLAGPFGAPPEGVCASSSYGCRERAACASVEGAVAAIAAEDQTAAIRPTAMPGGSRLLSFGKANAPGYSSIRGPSFRGHHADNRPPADLSGGQRRQPRAVITGAHVI